MTARNAARIGREIRTFPCPEATECQRAAHHVLFLAWKAPVLRRQRQGNLQLRRYDDFGVCTDFRR
jgi:hypothetical protein